MSDLCTIGYVSCGRMRSGGAGVCYLGNWILKGLSIGSGKVGEG